MQVKFILGAGENVVWSAFGHGPGMALKAPGKAKHGRDGGVAGVYSLRAFLQCHGPGMTLKAPGKGVLHMVRRRGADSNRSLFGCTTQELM